MKRALVLMVVCVATACTMGTERETLLMVDGVPVVVAVSGQRSCVEVGDAADKGRWCAPGGEPEAVWLGAASVGDRLVVAGQAPTEVRSVVLMSPAGTTGLAVEHSGLGRFFVGVDLPPGDYQVSAETADGNAYVSGEMSMSARATTLTTMTP